MHDHNISSLAVYGAPGHYLSSGDKSLLEHQGKQYFSVLTISDIVAWLVGNPVGIDTATVFDACGKSTVWAMNLSDRLINCIEPMAKGGISHNQGVHTFLVAHRNTEEGIFVVSQTDILTFLAHGLEDSGCMQQQIKDVIELPRDLLIATTDMRLNSLFRQMVDLYIRSVPVVDVKGSLVDYFSFTDLAPILWDASRNQMLSLCFSLLDKQDLTVSDFLFIHRNGVGMKPGVYAFKNGQIGEVIKLALHNRVHQVWIVNHDMEPIGILSYSDMIDVLWKFGRSEFM